MNTCEVKSKSCECLCVHACVCQYHLMRVSCTILNIPPSTLGTNVPAINEQVVTPSLPFLPPRCLDARYRHKSEGKRSADRWSVTATALCSPQSTDPPERWWMERMMFALAVSLGIALLRRPHSWFIDAACSSATNRCWRNVPNVATGWTRLVLATRDWNEFSKLPSPSSHQSTLKTI